MHRAITGRLVIATHNKGKLAEMRELLGRHGVEAVSASELNLPEPEETGMTFAANARIKAGRQPLTGTVSAVSVGIVGGVPLLDLRYEEDVRAETDMNVVCTGDGRFVEVQGTAEAEPFARDELNSLLDLAVSGCAELTALQRTALDAALEK